MAPFLELNANAILCPTCTERISRYSQASKIVREGIKNATANLPAKQGKLRPGIDV